MTTATKAKTKETSMTVIDFLESGFPPGTEVQVVTDNDLYGAKLTVLNGSLYNVRTRIPLLVTEELLFRTKVKLVTTEKQVSLQGFISAYNNGKTIKIVLPDGNERNIKKMTEQDIPEFIRGLQGLMGTVIEEVVTMQELTAGKFYVVD